MPYHSVYKYCFCYCVASTQIAQVCQQVYRIIGTDHVVILFPHIYTSPTWKYIPGSIVNDGFLRWCTKLLLEATQTAVRIVTPLLQYLPQSHTRISYLSVTTHKWAKWERDKWEISVCVMNAKVKLIFKQVFVQIQGTNTENECIRSHLEDSRCRRLL